MTTPDSTPRDAIDPAEFDMPRDVIEQLVFRMIERRVPVTRANLAHAVEAEQIYDLLDEKGVRIKDDGRRDQVSPTSDHRGVVRLSFEQIYRILGVERPARPGFRD